MHFKRIKGNVMIIDTVKKKIALEFTFQDNPGLLLKIGKIGLSRLWSHYNA